MKHINVLLGVVLLFSPSIFAQDNAVQSSDTKPYIATAVFATNIKNRVPENILTTADNSLKKIYFFTDARNLTGSTITHRWFYEGRLMAEVPLSIGGWRWRTWSSKNLWHTWLGNWSVEVVDEAGNTLIEKSFTYTQ